MPTSEARLKGMESGSFSKQKLNKKSNIYECAFLVLCENRQDRDRAVIVQICGDSFCFREWNYFSSLECGWKNNIILYA